MKASVSSIFLQWNNEYACMQMTSVPNDMSFGPFDSYYNVVITQMTPHQRTVVSLALNIQSPKKDFHLPRLLCKVNLTDGKTCICLGLPNYKTYFATHKSLNSDKVSRAS